MKREDRIKVFKRTAARKGLFFATWILKHISFPALRVVTNIFFFIGFPFLVKQKNIAWESLQIGLGKEKALNELKKIHYACFSNLARGMMELMYAMEHPEWIKKLAYFEGKEHLDAALKQGNGVILVSAHFGIFPLMLLRCVQEGYATSAIIRQTRDETVEKYFLDLRTRLGLKTIYAVPRKECVDISLKALRNNELVFIPLDQNFGSGRGVFVDFFGQKAATATGPVVLSMRTKAPIVPIFTVRDKDNRHKIIVEPPMALDYKADDRQTVEFNIARITQVIEQYIRRYPQEWGWMHRRWKTQPTADPAAEIMSEQIA